MTEIKKEQTIEKSNDERDQDEGNMNNGTIGGDIGISSSSNDENQADTSKEDESETANSGTEGSAAGK